MISKHSLKSTTIIKGLLLFSLVVTGCKKDTVEPEIIEPVIYEDATFFWDMESLTANRYSGVGEPTPSSFILTNDYAHTGEKSILFPGLKYSLAEFITDDQKTPEYERNPDFDFDLGTVEFYFLYTDSSHWIRGSQIISLKNELIDPTALNVEMNHPGKLSINFHSTYYSSKCDGATIGEWHKVLLKWKRLGTAVNLYLQIDDNQAVDEQFEITEEFKAHLDSTVETQIFIGNDTYREAQFYIDDFTIWRKWKE